MDFTGTAILVVGDVMLDHYIVGSANRVSPEAPVPVVSKQGAWTVPGGAANVARGLSRLGCNARLVGLVAQDPPGETLKKEIAAEGIEAGLVISSGRPTCCKTRIIVKGQQLLRVDDEVIRQPSLEERIALRLNVEKLLPGCKAIILSDYAKGVLLRDKNGESLCQDIICMAGNVPVLVDPKGIDWERYAGASCVTPNTSEFTRICDSLAAGAKGTQSISDGRHEQDLADEICAAFNLKRLLLTRGAKGMTLFEPGEKSLRIHATMREVADVSGAGDTVVAVLAACVAQGLSWGESARIANMAAGVAVGKMGTAPVGIDELNLELRQGRDNPKLFNLKELLEKIGEWRRQGQRIVFTNGCFDLLHPGHISLLRQSAAFGDRLIVGLNSDSSVKRLKGAERPIQNEQSRALLLAALQPVDAVILFEDDTPQKLVEALRPDFLVKGNDYKVEDIAGADFVLKNGGQVKLVNLVDGCSTTGLVRRMRTENAEDKS